MTASTIAEGLLFGGVGLAIGAFHFLSLRTNARLHLAGTGGWQPVALHVGRLAVTAGLFIVVAQAGAVPLLAAFAGFLVARFAILSASRRQP